MTTSAVFDLSINVFCITVLLPLLDTEQAAGTMGVETALLLVWESGTRTPDVKQWQILSELFSFDSGIHFGQVMNHGVFAALIDVRICLSKPGPLQAT
jgi:hypothetical protein